MIYLVWTKTPGKQAWKPVEKPDHYTVREDARDAALALNAYGLDVRVTEHPSRYGRGTTYLLLETLVG